MRYSLLWILSIFMSCSLTDSDDVTPSFIDVSSVTVATEQGQGSGSHDIDDLQRSLRFLQEYVEMERTSMPSNILFMSQL